MGSTPTLGTFFSRPCRDSEGEWIGGEAVLDDRRMTGRNPKGSIWGHEGATRSTTRTPLPRGLPREHPCHAVCHAGIDGFWWVLTG